LGTYALERIREYARENGISVTSVANKYNEYARENRMLQVNEEPTQPALRAD